MMYHDRRKYQNYIEYNDRLEELTIIEGINGGMDLLKYMNQITSIEECITLNQSLIQLLENGIIPMNQAGLYHMDIKGVNVVYDLTMTRLIDWGVAMLASESSPWDAKGRMVKSFQYNIPLGSCLFAFKPDVINIDKVMRLIKTNKYFKPYIMAIANRYMEVTDRIDFFTFCKDYLEAIINEFSNDGMFDHNEYYRTVYLPNIDIWGFISIYYTFISNKSLRSHFKAIPPFLLKYMFNVEYATKPIPHQEVIVDLHHLIQAEP